MDVSAVGMEELLSMKNLHYPVKRCFLGIPLPDEARVKYQSLVAELRKLDLPVRFQRDSEDSSRL